MLGGTLNQMTLGVAVEALILWRNLLTTMGTCAIKDAILAYGPIHHREPFFSPIAFISWACVLKVLFQLYNLDEVYQQHSKLSLDPLMMHVIHSLHSLATHSILAYREYSSRLHFGVLHCREGRLRPVSPPSSTCLL
jgi:hypothetical protein